MQALEALYRLEENRPFNNSARTALLALHNEYQRLTNALARDDRRRPRAAQEPGDPAVFVRALAALMKADFSQVRQRFFPEDDPADRPLQYLIYRYDTKPGRILKSFLELRPPSDDREACIFIHTAKVPRQVRLRRTIGIVLPFGATLSFVGQMTDGPGLKVMTLPMPTSARDRYNGLLLSFDEKDAPVSSRFVMVRTQHDRPEAAGIGVFPQHHLETEIADFVDEMRNEIPFVGDRQVFNRGKPLTQQQVIDLVEARLRDAGDELVDAEGRPFTPVATLAAAYNAALRIVSE